jgi:GMP synthase (glutamine-hydrolysing)
MSREKRVLVFRHAEPEHPGLLAEVLEDNSVALTTVNLYEGESIPSVGDYDGVVVMGGPQSVYEEAQFPFLIEEKLAIRELLKRKVPLIGICLGSQLIAEALGAYVHSSGRFELGWKEVVLNKECANDPVFGVLPPKFTPLHWHGDIYDLPKGAISIGHSELTSIQGFSYQGNCHALLFHLEMTLEQIEKMAVTFAGDLERAGLEQHELLTESLVKTKEIEAVGRELFSRWVARL